MQIFPLLSGFYQLFHHNNGEITSAETISRRHEV